MSDYKIAAKEFSAQAFSGKTLLTHSGLWICFPYPTPQEAAGIPEEEIFRLIQDWCLQTGRADTDPREVLASLRQECGCGQGTKGSVAVTNFIHAVCDGGDAEDALLRTMMPLREEERDNFS